MNFWKENVSFYAVLFGAGAIWSIGQQIADGTFTPPRLVILGIAIYFVVVAVLLTIRFRWAPEATVLGWLSISGSTAWAMASNHFVSNQGLYLLLVPLGLIAVSYFPLKRELRPPVTQNPTDTCAFYSETLGPLSAEWMQGLGDVEPEIEPYETGTRYKYSWPGLTLFIHEEKEAIEDSVVGYANLIENQAVALQSDRGQQIADRIRRTKMVLGIIITPGGDSSGRANAVLEKISHHLRALILVGLDLYDWKMRLVMGADGSYDPESEF